jgi:hypothetical protein
VLLRSYKSEPLDKDHYIPSAAHETMKAKQGRATISLAARTASAAPKSLLGVNCSIPKPLQELSDDDKMKKLVSRDGHILNNNPIDQLRYARYELVHHVKQPPPILCIISLGTGRRKTDSPENAKIRLAGVMNGVMDFSRDMNAKANDCIRHTNRLKNRSE